MDEMNLMGALEEAFPGVQFRNTTAYGYPLEAFSVSRAQLGDSYKNRTALTHLLYDLVNSLTPIGRVVNYARGSSDDKYGFWWSQI